MAKSPWFRYLSFFIFFVTNNLFFAITDCQLGVIKPRLLNSEKRKATSLLLLDLNITLGLQESIAFKSSKVIGALKISTSLIHSTNNSICLSFKIDLKGFSVLAIWGIILGSWYLSWIGCGSSRSCCGCISACTLFSFFFRKYAEYLSNTTALTTTEK